MTEEQQPQQTPRRSAGAAASRARRIGGRVTPRSAPPAAEGGAPVGLTKPAAPTELTPQPRPTPAPDRAQPDVVVEVPTWLKWAPAAALIAGVIAMAIVLVTFSHGVWWGKQSSSVQREKVLAAAKTCVATTNTYKYTQLDAFETKALTCATGTFRSQLKNTIDKIIKVNAPQFKASQTAQISRGGVEAITDNGRQWTVLLFGQLAVTNTNYPKGRTDPFAAEVRMERVGGKWLMSDLKTVSTPVS